jgi:hypothetical protein
MKKLLFVLLAGSVMAVLFSSCTSMKKDCLGNRHYKLKNGIYL